MSDTRIGSLGLLGIGTLGGLMVVLGGCEHSSMSSILGKSGETVQPADFAGGGGSVERGTSAPTTTQADAIIDVTKRRETTPVVTIGSSNLTHSGGSGLGAPTPPANLTATVGSPTPSASATAKSTVPVTIDAVVGQINGKPVFVSEILEPLDGTLRAAADQAKSVNSWKQAAAEPIVRELRRRIEDELILSEARNSLTPEQRQGLLRFLGQIESSLISSQQGSEVKADEDLRQQTGRSLHQEAEDIKDKEMIRNELRQKVSPRVMVSWRDVQNEYERQHDKFHPPAEYTFHMIYTGADKSSSIDKIQTGLAGGTKFTDLAGQEFNNFNSREQGKLVRKVAGSQAETDFSPVPELNEAMRSIGVGETRGPIMYTPSKSKPDVKNAAWVYLERIDQPQGVSLYDAQLELENDLREERTNAEIQRYFERLRKRGNVSKIEVMADRLMGIATDRYAPRFSGK